MAQYPGRAIATREAQVARSIIRLPQDPCIVPCKGRGLVDTYIGGLGVSGEGGTYPVGTHMRRDEEFRDDETRGGGKCDFEGPMDAGFE